MDRYGHWLERDLLRVYGVDLGAEWRARRWRRLLNLIDGLPSNSQYMQALLNDDEYCEALVTTDAPSAGPALADWSPEVDQLARVTDLLQQLIRAFISANGGKGGKFRPAPRPETGIERARRRKLMAEVQELRSLWSTPEGDDDA
jgi:hypothetical protein